MLSISRTIQVLIFIVLGVLHVQEVDGQSESIPDTLDWRGYFPLEVGNKWQYYNETTGSLGRLEEWYETWEIVGETLNDSLLLFDLAVSCDSIYADPFFPFYTPSCNPDQVKELRLRYDDQLKNVVEQRTISPDSSIESLWFQYDFRLDADFNSTSEASSGSGLVHHYYGGFAEVEISNHSVPATVKEVATGGAIPTSFGFAHGIGLIRFGFNEGGGTVQELIFAQVSGEEYGSAYQVSNQHVEGPLKNDQAVLFPNPSGHRTTLRFKLREPGVVEISVFDALGRLVNFESSLVLGIGTYEYSINTENMAVGTYFIVARDESQIVVRKSFHVVR